MALVYDYLIPGLWLGWVLYWYAAAINVKRSTRVESFGSNLLHLVPLVLAITLFVRQGRNGILYQPLWHRSPFTFWLGIGLMLSGFAITFWARQVLGRNWSSNVTVKEDHELIQTGPYAYARHPIYTGLLLAFFGSAVSVGEWRGVLSFLLVLLAFRIKLAKEERWMTEIFGTAYENYRKHVRMLIPFIW